VKILILDTIVTYHTISRAQTSLDGLVVKVEKALLVIKATLKEFCLELIVGADLVSLTSYFQNSIEPSFFSVLPFHGPAILPLSITLCLPQAHRFWHSKEILYCKCSDGKAHQTWWDQQGTHHHTCILYLVFSTNLITEYFISYFDCHRWVDDKGPPLVLFF